METMSFSINISELGVSQLYLSEEKLDNVAKWFDMSKINDYEPLPVYDFGNGRYTLTDGHTRAYTMWKSGLKKIRVQLDADEMITCALGQMLYKTDIEWCEKYNVHNVADFGERVLASEKYAVLWLERCKRLHNLLNLSSDYEKICEKYSDLMIYGANIDGSEVYFEDCKGKFYLYRDGGLQEDSLMMENV